MNNMLIGFVVSAIEAARPEVAPFLDKLRAMITSGAPVTVADIEQEVHNAFTAAEADLPKFKNSLVETDKFLIQGVVMGQSWAVDLAAK